MEFRPVCEDILEVLVNEQVLYPANMPTAYTPADAWPATLIEMPIRPVECVTLVDGVPMIISRTFNSSPLQADGLIIQSRALTYRNGYDILTRVVNELDSYRKFGLPDREYAYQHLMLQMPITYLGKDENSRFLCEVRYSALRW